MHPRTSSVARRLALSALVAVSLSAVVPAQVVGTATVTNAAHSASFGSPENTVANITPSTTAGATFRQISYSGTLTSVIPATFGDEALIDITGPGFSTPQFFTVALSETGDTFTSETYSGTFYAPGGVDATQTLSIEHVDAISDGAGADALSTTTYTFQAGYTAPFSVEAAGELTASDPTYNRPTTLTALSTIGTNVFYNVQEFTVGATGEYLFANAGGYDTFLSLYTGAFSPSTPLDGLVALNDEDLTGTVLRSSAFAPIDPAEGSGGTARITSTLTAGTTYFLVTSSYGNGQTGNFINAYIGPGSINFANAVPEPATLAAFALGLPLLAARRRAKRS